MAIPLLGFGCLWEATARRSVAYLLSKEIPLGLVFPSGISNGTLSEETMNSALRLFTAACWPFFLAVGGLAESSPSPSSIVPTSTPAPSVSDQALLAHWTFDDSDGSRCVNAAGSGCEAVRDSRTSSSPRVAGLYGKALSLQGTHAWKTQLAWTQMPGLSFSVWVRPTVLSGFRELFRQECPNRLLFSFQEGGTILSLGLNIGGYLECDARIQPDQLLDGRWHHCAATFDGQWMRVYLDGGEIGALQHPGTISFSPEIPAFIGSSEGSNEYFQGALDDLRVYAKGLGAQEVTALFGEGARSLEARDRELQALIGGLYPTGQSFAQTLASLRRTNANPARKEHPDLALALNARLRTGFPEECRDFYQYTGITPLDYLSNADADLDARMAGRLLELLVEYKPLTENQRARQAPESASQWQAAEGLQQRFDQLLAGKQQTQFSPEWIQLILDAGPQVQFRPSTHEPVAPYLKPETPSTLARSSSEARQMLEKDWLYQADDKPTVDRIRQEMDWTRALARRIGAKLPGREPFQREMAELDRLEKSLDALSSKARIDLYTEVRALKRSILFRNPALDFSKVLLVDMPLPQGSEWQHETRHRLGYMAVPGARLLVLDGLRPDGKLTQLMPQAPLHGSFWRPDISFDARKVLFCFKPHNEKSFHLYEINVDGSGLKQLTDGPYDDLDPVYLPDQEHVLFSTTRGNTYVRCMPPTSAFVLARANADGKNIYLISANNEPDYLPSVMNDGRVVYTRWEYTDKPLWRAQKLWTVNPDGTQTLMFWGNQSVWPDVMKDARNIPGSRRVMFTGSAHHNWFSGSVGIIDPDQGFNFPWGLTKVTADVAWPECGNGPVDPAESPEYHSSGRFDAYYSPYPLSEQDFLVSAQRQGKFALYLMDVEGNRELVYEGTHQVLHAMPLKARPIPPVPVDRVAWPKRDDSAPPKAGLLFSSDIYQGAPPELRGKAHFLRIFSIDHKTYTYWYKRPYISTGPVVSAVQSEGVKRLLGTVPIEADGSVNFEAPPGIPLHFQLLDEQQRALQTMRSFVNVMPGESRGCLGCHESHSRTPEMANRPIALTRAPSTITPPPWPDVTVSYPRYVRPVLDRYCGRCHQGDGEGRKKLDLTERPTEPVFTEPYWTLIGRPTWGQPYQMPKDPPPGFGIAGCLLVEAYGTVDPKAYVTPPPMTTLSYRSKLIEMVTSGKHHDVKVDEISRLRLIAWVDAMCPYMGEDEIKQIPDPVFQGVDWLAVRPRIATAPQVNRPGPVP